jgi:hypothetical protein
MDGYAVGQRREVELAVLEAWAWMEAQAVLVRTDVHGEFGFRALSLTGAEFYRDADFDALAAAGRLDRRDLHHALHAEALENFWRQSYDLSVFAAMKAELTRRFRIPSGGVDLHAAKFAC